MVALSRVVAGLAALGGARAELRGHVAGGGRELGVRDLAQVHTADLHVDGFVPTVVYTHALDARGLAVRLHRQEVRQSEAMQRRVLQEQLPMLTKRDKVVSLMKLCLIAYEKGGYYGEEAMAPIFAAGDGTFHPSDYQADVDAMNNLFDEIQAAVWNETRIYEPGPAERAIETIGVVAIEWKHPDVGTVLSFRGSASTHDYNNILLWTKDWILEKSTEQLKKQWTEIAQLEWTSEMAAREEESTLVADVALRAGSWFYADSSPDSFASAWAEAYSITEEEALKFGYWPATKAVVTRTIAGLADGEKLVLSGHSQGGARAALAAMWQDKVNQVKHESITFAAVGGTCFARNLGYEYSDLLEDVDPFAPHTHITDYVDALDIYGFLGIDPGNMCVYGTTNVKQRAAAKYCAEVFGYSGPTILSASSLGNTALDNALKRCLYHTHYSPAMIANLGNSVYLKEDGTTDGGCSIPGDIPVEDPDGRCPTGEVPLVFWLASGGLLAVVISVVLLVCCCTGCLLRRACRKKVRPE